MARKQSPAEKALLETWAGTRSPDHLKLAQRSWCVLKSLASTKDLSSMGLSEERILCIRDAYDAMGVVGLVDAPRKGRPPITEARKKTPLSEKLSGTPQTDPVTGGLSKDMVWRSVRLEGRSLTRSRMLPTLHPTLHTGGKALAGLFLSAEFGAALLEDTHAEIISGVWYHPPALARRKCASTIETGSFKVQAGGLLHALIAHEQFPAKSTIRGEREKIAFWCSAIGKLANKRPSELFLCANAEGGDLEILLKEFRKHLLWEGEGGLLQKFVVLDAAQWKKLLASQVRFRPDSWPRSGMQAFAWAELVTQTNR